MRRLQVALLFAGQILAAQSTESALPGRYFRLLEAGSDQVAARLSAQPSPELKTLETGGHRWHLFPHTILVAAVLYTAHDPSNRRYHESKMLDLALKIGDLL